MSTTSDGTNSQTYDGGLFAERRVISYAELLASEVVAQRVIDKLGLDMGADELQEEIEVGVPTETVLIDVTVSDRSPTRARDIANTLADEFVVMAAGLETPELGAQPNARVIVLQRAEISDDPVSSKSVRTLGIAGVIGALIGVLAAVVRDRSDDAVRTEEDIEKATGVGLLADIPLVTGHHGTLLISFERDHSAVADAFRALRINIRFLEVTTGPRVIVVTSAMPDEGRTTVAVNLSLALAETNHDVVIVDGDLRHPDVASRLEISTPVGLSTVLAGETALPAALQQTRFPRLTALTSGPVPPNPADLLESPAAKEVLRELGDQFDYVIIDSPSLLVPDAAVLAANSQGLLVITRSGKTKRHQLVDALNTLRRAGAPLLGAVRTMTPGRKQSAVGSSDGTADSARPDARLRGGHRRRASYEK